MGSIFRPYITEDSPELEPRVDEDEIFSLFALLAIYVEAEDRKWRQHVARLSSYGKAIFERLLPLFDLRFSKANEVQVREALKAFTFERDQQRFAVEWCTARISLVEPRRHSTVARKVTTHPTRAK